jgi:PAS domain S-box-containing protein
VIPLPLPNAIIPWHRRLEARVLFGVTIVAGLAMVGVVVATRAVVSRSSLEHASADLVTAREAFDRLVRTRGDAAAKETRLIVELPVFRSSLSSGDGPTMDTTAADYCGKLGAHICIVTNRQGRWIGQAGGWPGANRPAGIVAVIEPARQGRSSRDIVTVDGVLYLVVAEPAMFSADEVLGTFTAAYALDDDVATQLAQDAHCAVTLLCGAWQICASSLPSADRAALLEALQRQPDALGPPGAAPVRRDLGGVPYVGAVGELPHGARLIVLQDWRPTEQALSRIHQAVLTVGLMGFGLAIGGALLFSRRLTRPMRNLAAVASDVAGGQWTRRVPIDGPAEARMTAEAFNHMTAALTHWRDEAEARAEEVRTAYERFRAVTDSASDAIISTDGSGNIVFWSKRAQVVFGYEEREALGAPFASLVPERHRAMCAAEIARQSASDPDAHRSARTIELCGVRRDRVEVPMEMSISTWKAGQEIFHTGIIRDITDRKQAEAALKQREEQLRQAQKMEAIGRLAGGVAHDFNNLLTAILGYTHLLQAEMPPDHPLRADLDEIEQAGNSAASLTRELLAFSRKQVLQPVVLDINAVVVDTEKLLRRLVGEDIEVVLSLAPDLAHVRADRSQIEQIIMNLAVNARDAMPTGGRLTIGTAGTALDGAPIRKGMPPIRGRQVLLRVSDTGHGMSPDLLRHIFEPFFTTKEVGKGTGLGLATVYGTVKQSGGYIWVDSEVGKGTTFHICLPAIDAATTDEPGEDTLMPAIKGSETVLLVEDNEAVRGLARETLVRAGYEVLVAGNGVEGLRVATEHLSKISLVVTDVVMPVMGGPELVSRLRELRRDLKIVLMSGYSDDPDLRGNRPDLAAAFVQKPFTPAQLARVVRETIDGSIPVST